MNVEDDLLQFAVESTFNGDRAVKSIRILASPLRPGILNSLRRNKFAKGDRVETGGIQSWDIYWYNLESRIIGNRQTDQCNVAPDCYYHLRTVPSSLSFHCARVLSCSVLLACLARIRKRPRCDHPCSALLPPLPSICICSRWYYY